MTAPGPIAVHATALVVGEAGVLIRGRSGAGKSSLAEAIMAEAARRGLFARLVGDDRVRLSVAGGRVVARPHPRIAGMIERRGEGVVPVASEPAAILRLVADIAAEGETPERAPDSSERTADLHGVVLRRLRLKGGAAAQDQARRVLAALDGGAYINRSVTESAQALA